MLGLSTRPPIASLNTERRSAVDSNRSSGVQTIDAPTVVLTMPELQSSRVLMPAVPAVAVLVHGGPHVHLRHPMTNGSRWRGMGEVCPQSTVTAAAAQGGRIAGQGAYDVTDTKFSTSMGPPSCSPPV
jgi:hypothetical protein